ncbi:cytochrome o ubiquinol/quinol oxidase subunit IV [Croceicoccus sp. YJ47]|uniref:cytochrome o ubiquinol oxidase subunit IV n=1 Tax=Croceicoccus sp. YJ47 TaxID=2798724 RepID=UPI0019206843|nr:cytochrome C oxidase subunit IV family protein [Croceicoccus sp. YJ47]QQN74721.1 cytochrome C oxidase subunit IV family protein [Croceicoccus sp. YJ47]
MSRPNTGELDPGESAKAELRKYALGFVISVGLTVAAFAAVLSPLAPMVKIIAVCAAALLQVATHLRHFLHLSFSGGQSREDLLLVLFSVCLLSIMAGGTVWILADLQERMHEGETAHTAPTTGEEPAPAA